MKINKRFLFVIIIYMDVIQRNYKNLKKITKNNYRKKLA